MRKLRMIMGIVAVGLISTVGVSYAVDNGTNTVTVDSNVLGPQWIGAASQNSTLALLAGSTTTTIGGTADYAASSTIGLGAMTNNSENCVRTTADDGLVTASGAGCDYASASPQTAGDTIGTNQAGGVITQSVVFDLAEAGSNMIIQNNSRALFSMNAADRSVTQMETAVDQVTTLVTNYAASEADAANIPVTNTQTFAVSTVLDAAGAFTAGSDQSETGAAGSGTVFNVALAMAQDTLVDINNPAAVVDNFTNSGAVTTGDSGAIGAGVGMPPGYTP